MSSDNKNEENNVIENNKEAKGEIGNNRINESQNKLNKEELRDLPSYEYIRMTVQKEIQQGLLYISKNNPKNPIKFLGEFLIEKSKSYNI